MKPTVRIATPDDAHAACAVLRRSISECCVEDHHNNPEVLSAWLSNKTPENVASWFASPVNFAVVATSGKEINGVGLLSLKGEVTLCYVAPEVRFTGVGKAVLQALESHALSLGLSAIHLSSTFTAKVFYLRNGFTSSGTSKVAFGVKAFPLLKRLSANNTLNPDAANSAAPVS
jgi:GNAT superfamily N-acetyltransferase